MCQALFYRFKIFNADLVGVENKKVKLLLNKPVYIGQTILDLSKLVIYDFHYNLMKNLYEDNIKLLFTDTDCLMYEIETPNLNGDIVKYNSMFDLSNYPVDHPLHDDANKKIVLKFKNETAGNLWYFFIDKIISKFWLSEVIIPFFLKLVLLLLKFNKFNIYF